MLECWGEKKKVSSWLWFWMESASFLWSLHTPKSLDVGRWAGDSCCKLALESFKKQSYILKNDSGRQLDACAARSL